MRKAAQVIAVAALLVWAGAQSVDPRAQGALQLRRSPGAQPKNIIFVLVDDLRYDALGFMGHPWLETPHLDALAQSGVQMRNAFVTTALCSPSRASILTGQYAHRHRVVDNNNPVPPGTIFFPQYLQQAGYETAFIGKWHMGGDSDAPQPGFDRWVSFRGQGTYLPSTNGLNVDGKAVPQHGYITDELTDYALDWLKQRRSTIGRSSSTCRTRPSTPTSCPPSGTRAATRDKPFTAAADDGRHAGELRRQADVGAEPAQQLARRRLPVPQRARHRRVLPALRRNAARRRRQRRPRHRAAARARAARFDTIVIYMGDNGFAFGEHGLIDKRTAYEESMRVPLLMSGGGLPAGTTVEEVVANIDIAPTILDAAGLTAAADGRPQLRCRWRAASGFHGATRCSTSTTGSATFPQTPTMHALRGERYKYIRYYGLWDTDELYDLQADPLETRNLIRDPAHRDIVTRLNAELFETLAETGGMYIPLAPDAAAIRRTCGGATDRAPPIFHPTSMRR